MRYRMACLLVAALIIPVAVSQARDIDVTFQDQETFEDPFIQLVAVNSSVDSASNAVLASCSDAGYQLTTGFCDVRFDDLPLRVSGPVNATEWACVADGDQGFDAFGVQGSASCIRARSARGANVEVFETFSSTTDATVSCPGAQVAVSGGCASTLVDNLIKRSEPRDSDGDGDADSWLCEFQDIDPNDVSAHVVCADGGGPGERQGWEIRQSIGTAGATNVDVSCSSNSRVIFGGGCGFLAETDNGAGFRRMAPVLTGGILGFGVNPGPPANSEFSCQAVGTDSDDQVIAWAVCANQN